MTRERDPAKADEIERWIDAIVAANSVLAMNAACFRVAARLMHRRTGALMEDAMIAATAQVHDLIVVTRNLRDFATLGARTLDPFAPA